MDQVRCLIVDANPLVRNCLQEVLSAHAHMQVQGTVSGLQLAKQRILQDPPDVLVLGTKGSADGMMRFLRGLMRNLPTPVVLLVEVNSTSTALAAEALALGAVDVIEKTVQHPEEQLRTRGRMIADRIFRAAFARVTQFRDSVSAEGATGQGPPERGGHFRYGLIALGASTGGVEALGRVIQAFRCDLPPVVITQHIPEGFSELFASRLDRRVKVDVQVAAHGARAMPGHVYIAPGHAHLEVVRRSGLFWLKLQDAAPVNRHRPSVDVLFASVAEAAGSGAIVGLLTGMGEDGARGLASCRARGAHTFAQDQDSCKVFGMPRVAIEMDAVEEVLSLDQIAQRIWKLTHG